MRDDRPEREKYGHMSLAEQLGDELRAFWGTKPLVALVAVLVAGWAILTFTRPEVVRVAELAPGDCIYVLAPDRGDSGSGRPAGTTNSVLQELYRSGAERAPCDGSHGHEVADTWRLEGAAFAPYPGPSQWLGEVRPRCEAAFVAYVGHPVEGSSLELLLAMPPQDAWDNGTRQAACLVGNRDGTFLAGPAKGSGR